MLVMNELIDDAPYLADLEVLRMALLQAYIASAGLILLRPRVKYCVSALNNVAVMLRLDWMYRAFVKNAAYPSHQKHVMLMSSGGYAISIR